MSRAPSPRELADRIEACTACPRLVEHCREVARVKRRAYRDEEYWGRPVPSFGPMNARLLVLGLAPGAHGANRTGRVFTGDSSGDWLYRALFEAGFANRAESVTAGDGLRLRDARVSCVVRCAPPGNRPTAAERRTCSSHLVDELHACRRIEVILALGRFAFEGLLQTWRDLDREPWERVPKFGHGAEVAGRHGGITLLTSYHPSRQNTQTGRLSREQFAAPFARARELLG